jgi:hypothetical protein
VSAPPTEAEILASWDAWVAIHGDPDKARDARNERDERFAGEASVDAEPYALRHEDRLLGKATLPHWGSR